MESTIPNTDPILDPLRKFYGLENGCLFLLFSKAREFALVSRKSEAGRQGGWEETLTSLPLPHLGNEGRGLSGVGVGRGVRPCFESVTGA